MRLQGEADNAQEFIITLEIAPEDMYDADSALIGAIKRDATDSLLLDGYRIQFPTVTYRGGGTTVEVITYLTTLAANTWAYKGIAEEVLNDLSALITIFSGAIPIATHILQAHKKNVDKDEPSQQPIRVTIEIDDATISVEASDLEQTEVTLKLAQQFHTKHPFIAAKVTPQSKVKIKDRIPKKKPRRRK